MSAKEQINQNQNSSSDIMTAKQIPTIRHIDHDCIRFIAAGEKINDIETVIRELIENSVDAKATNIEIRLGRFGIESIEVEDNGTGIDESDFQFLGQRYHTSKIDNFNKLQSSLETYGFRGEALSCLCTISNVTIITKSSSSPTGTKLTFKPNGTIAKKEPIARSNGTSVIIRNLFHSLPVRRKELEHQAKRQYDKIVRVIYEHVLIRPDIRFTLCKSSKLRKEKDFTYGGTTLEKSIVSMFGIKVLESLVPIKQVDYEELDSVKKRGSQEEGSISTQSVIQIDSSINTTSEDQSLTITQTFEPSEPPNREKFFRRSTKSKFAREKPTYTVHGYISKIDCGRNSTDCQFVFVNDKPCELPRVVRHINDLYRGYSHHQSPFLCLFIQVQSWAADFNVPRKRAVILSEENRLNDLMKDVIDTMFSPLVPAMTKNCPSAQLASLTMKSDEIQKYCTQTPKRNLDERSDDDSTIPQKKRNTYVTPPKNLHQTSSKTLLPHNSPTTTSSSSVELIGQFRNNTPKVHTQNEDNMDCHSEVLTQKDTPDTILVDDFDHEQSRDSDDSSVDLTDQQKTGQLLAIDYFNCKFNQRNNINEERLSVAIENIDDLAVALERERAQRCVVKDSREYSFAIDPMFNTVSEQEMKLNLCRESFENMDIIGQFNNGFIITRYNDHLFIIDQHATDERANFEDQLDKCPMERQVMVRPKPLLLNSIQENTIVRNLDEFERRGFQFIYDENKPPGYRVQLSSTSICKGQGMDVYLDKSDIEELLNVAIESPSALPSYNLKKVKDLAASRACRKSVMIGDKLSESQMKSIVSKMSNLSNPWVCAHDRPTIRHLMDVEWMERFKKVPKVEDK